MKPINGELINGITKIKDNCIDCKKCVNNCEMLKEYCTSICHNGIDLGNLFMQMRKQIVVDNGNRSPLKGHRSIHMHQNFGFSKAFSGIYFSGGKSVSENKIQRVFLPGCSLCAYSPELVLKTYEYLNEKLPGTALLLQCCGRPTEVIGEEVRFLEKYSILLKNLEGFGEVEIITACQSCFSTINKYSPQKKVKSLWTVIKEIGLPINSLNVGDKSDICFAIHDSCITRDNVEIQSSIRWILNKIGYNIEVTKNSGKNTSCCGTGGMVHTVNGKLAHRIMKKTAFEAKTNYFVTYCAGCRQSITDGGKTAVHILELIFNETVGTDSKFDTSAPSSIKSWKNRYLIKRNASKILQKL